MRLGAFTAAVLMLCLARPASAADPPLIVKFDYSRGAIGLDVTVRGTKLHMILDTGVDPSAIDLRRAESLGLAIDRAGGGEASGQGDARQAQVFPTSITALEIGGRQFGLVEAAAMNMGTLSARYGRPLDGVLGYSFLNGRIVMIDYAGPTIAILDRVEDAAKLADGCRTRWDVALRSFAGDSIPLIPDFRIGTATGPVSLDTGSNGGLALYQSALALRSVRAAFSRTGAAKFAGARGEGTADRGVLAVAVGFGPFTLPAGQSVTLQPEAGSADTHVANIGNRLLAAMKLRLLLDYRARRMSFFGDCP